MYGRGDRHTNHLRLIKRDLIANFNKTKEETEQLIKESIGTIKGSVMHVTMLCLKMNDRPLAKYMK